MGFFIEDAWAQAGGQPDPFISLLPLVLVFVVFYFLLIRPQQKRAKEHREMVGKLTVGDEVVTAGGMVGRVTEVKDQFLRVEIAKDVEVVVQRHTVGAVVPKGTMKNA